MNGVEFVEAAWTPPEADVPLSVVPVPLDDAVGDVDGVGVGSGRAGTQPPTIGTSVPPTQDPGPLVPMGVEGPHVSVPTTGGTIPH